MARLHIATGQHLPLAGLHLQPQRAVRLQHLHHVAALRVCTLQRVGTGRAGRAGTQHAAAITHRHAGVLQCACIDTAGHAAAAGRVAYLQGAGRQRAGTFGRAQLDHRIGRRQRQCQAALQLRAVDLLPVAAADRGIRRGGLQWLCRVQRPGKRQRRVFAFISRQRRGHQCGRHLIACAGGLQRLRGLHGGKGQHRQHSTGQQGGMDRHGRLPHWARSLRRIVPRPKHSRRL
ncbi:hypothetical protein G6F24_014374 [Rhizopus arrhizus]|nr:hypothetical protein G6F24_014374 [Rhizopus arrhizus]